MGSTAELWSSIEHWSWIASIVGALVALVGLPFIAWQLQVARRQRLDAVRLSTSQVLLAVDSVLLGHQTINGYLRPKGLWAEEKGWIHPTNEEMWLVEPYLGIFERLFVAYSAGQVNAGTVEDLYGYRLKNIWANKRLVDEKLQHKTRKEKWKGVIGLTWVLEAYRGESYSLHTDGYCPRDLPARLDGKTQRWVRKRQEEIDRATGNSAARGSA